MAVPDAAQSTQVSTLRNILTSEQEPLARRFRALFSLKYLASLDPPSEETVPAIEAIAAGFGSPSALLKHELAYCLGQSRHDVAIEPLRNVLKDRQEDPMCRHEAAEALDHKSMSADRPAPVMQGAAPRPAAKKDVLIARAMRRESAPANASAPLAAPSMGSYSVDPQAPAPMKARLEQSAPMDGSMPETYGAPKRARRGVLGWLIVLLVLAVAGCGEDEEKKPIPLGDDAKTSSSEPSSLRSRCSAGRSATEGGTRATPPSRCLGLGELHSTMGRSTQPAGSRRWVLRPTRGVASSK